MGRSRSNLFLVLLLLTLLLVSGTAIFSSNILDDEKEKPDIVLLTVDSLRSDYIDCESNFSNTPNICGLKEDSVSFEKGYSHASYTPAAMSSVMTGKHPWEVGMTSMERGEISNETQTLAEFLKEQGYTNKGLYEIGAVSPEYGFDRGFDVYKENGDRQFDNAELADIDKSPQFKYFHLFGPHQPFRATSDCSDFSRRMSETPKIGVEDVNQEYRENFSKEKAEECYASSVAATDKRIGIVTDILKERGKYRDSLIIFTADHGEGLWDNGETFQHSWSLHQEQINIPFYIKFPNNDYSVSSIDRSFARHIDLLPTVADYIGVNDGDTTGQSLLPVIEGNNEIKKVFSISRKSKSLIIEDNKLIIERDGKGKPLTKNKEFFNLEEDPNEEVNLYDEELVPESFQQISKIEVESKEDIHDEKLLNRLENLGYRRSSGTEDANPPTSENKESTTEEKSNSSYEKEDYEDPSELLIGNSSDLLEVNKSGFNYETMELVVDDDLKIINEDNRSHILTIENMAIETEVEPEQNITIRIEQGGDYQLRSDKFEEDFVSLDINAE